MLPFLKKEDINVHQKFLKFSNLLYNADLYIEKEADKCLEQVIVDNTLLIDKFLQIDQFLQRIILEKFVSNFYQDDLILINDKHISLLMKLILSQKSNSKVNLPNDVVVTKSYNKLQIERNPGIISSYEIEISNEVLLPNGHTLKRVDKVLGNSNNIIKLSSKELSLPLIVRTRKFGDMMIIKGGGKKKIKDIFIDKKIPIRDRDLWPVVVDSAGKVVFLPGLKKSKFDKTNEEFYDIILEYE